MDSRLLLVKAITLWYREAQTSNHIEDNSIQLIKDIIITIRQPEIIIEGDFGKDVVNSLKTTLMNLINGQLGAPLDKLDLLQRIRVNVGNEETLYQAVNDGIRDDLEIEDLRMAIKLHRTDLLNYLKRLRIKALLKEAHVKCSFNEDTIDWRHFVKEIVDELEVYRDMETYKRHASVVDDFDFTNFDTIRNSMANAESELSSDGIMRFGCQGINRMFGDKGGIRRGEFLVIGALQHNFKSGMALLMMKQLCLYNVPFLRDPTRKPMIMRITFENEAPLDLYWLYESIMENEKKVKINLDDVGYEEVINVVADRLQATGYTLNICRLDPSEFTFHDLFDRINEFEAKGYEVHALFLDYLNMMSKRGCNMGAQGQDVRDLFRRTRNFTSKKGIACITPHQLSTEALQLVRMGAENFVQEIANKAYWDSCKTIAQEVDMEIYQHIVKVNDESYLAIQRGKHRKVSITNPRDLYTVYKFEKVGGIVDDIKLKDMSRRSIGGATNADGGGDTWFN